MTVYIYVYKNNTIQTHTLGLVSSHINIIYICKCNINTCILIQAFDVDLAAAFAVNLGLATGLMKKTESGNHIITEWAHHCLNETGFITYHITSISLATWQKTYPLLPVNKYV